MNLWNNALCELDEDLVGAYACALLKKENEAVKRPAVFYIAIAACSAVGIFGAAVLWNTVYRRYHPAMTTMETVKETVLQSAKTQDETGEGHAVAAAAFERQYMTAILDEEYAGYHSVRVCDEAFVGEKLKEITVEGGWKNSDYEYIEPAETLRAEVYSLKDIPTETAVCLKFLDLGDALTTTHYYVYVCDGISGDTLNGLKESFGWTNGPDPGPAGNGTVTMTTAPGAAE